MIGVFMLYHTTSYYKEQRLVTSLKPFLSCPNRVEPMKEVTFVRNEQRYDLTTAGDPHWEAMLPSNGGFIAAADGINSSTTAVGISMFHQLHCLQIIRRAFQVYTDAGAKQSVRDEATPQIRKSGAQDAHAHHHGDQRHWVHCLDYLAQVRTAFPLYGFDLTRNFALSVSHVRRMIP